MPLLYFRYRLVLTVLLLIMWHSDTAIESSSTQSQMFGIKLRSRIEKLQREVEKLFGKPILEEKSELISFHGKTRVDDDGTPVLILHPSTGKTEETIAHELFHLKMIAQGSPTISFRLPATTSEPEQKKVLWLEYQLRGAIQHWMFYPLIRNMGLNPDRDINTELQQVLSGSRLKDLTDDQIQYELPVLYARAHLESENIKLKDQFSKWCEAKMGKAITEKAKRMIQQVTKTKPKTAKEELEVFLSCVNCLYEGRGSFTAEPWEYKTLGNFRLNTVTFRLVM